MLPLIYFGNMVFLLAEGTNIHCSSEKLCNCSLQNTVIIAHCNGLNLTTSPNFTEDVLGIDLGLNRIDGIPQNLPSGLILLNLTGNPYLRKIESDDLRRYNNLQHFDASHCRLRNIKKLAFRNNTNLQYLDISNNPELTLDVLKNVTRDLKYSNITTLRLDKLQCTYGISTVFRTDYIKHLSNSHLKVLSVASNRISYFEHDVFVKLPNTLEELNVGDNSLGFGSYLLFLSNLKGLKILNATFQNSFHLTRRISCVCNDSWNSNFLQASTPCAGGINYQNEMKFKPCTNGNSNHSKMNTNIHISTFVSASLTIYGPPNLERFYFHDNMYKLEVRNYQFNLTYRKLTHLFLQNNILYKLSGPLRGLQSVQYLDLSNNLCAYISVSFFDEFDGVIQLNLSRNMLSTCIENDTQGQIFQRLIKLKILDISYNRVRKFPRLIFQYLDNLSELYVKFNSLETFNVLISHMQKLSFLDLSNNQITTLDATFRTSLQSIILKTKFTQINLYKNTLKCSCEEYDFMQWLKKYKDHILKLSKYECISPNSSSLSFKNLDHIISSMEMFCATYFNLIVVLTIILFVIMTIIVGAISNRYRWRLRYLYFLAKRRYTEVQHLQQANTDSYRYDAFVSYAEEDKDFILRKLNFLEKDNNLKLCVHCRDFIPGTDIADNIANAIHNSRRTLCVLTSFFLDSYWCMYELNMARMESIYSRKEQNILCIVILDKTVFQKVPLKIVDLLESQSYLEYPDNGNEDLSFWNKLSLTLQSPVS